MESPNLRDANNRRTAAGAASQVALAYRALRRATDPGVIAVLRARIDHPNDSLGQIANRLRVSRDSYAGRLRRALAAPETTTTWQSQPEPVPLRAGQPSPRSARAINIGMGRRRVQ